MSQGHLLSLVTMGIHFDIPDEILEKILKYFGNHIPKPEEIPRKIWICRYRLCPIGPRGPLETDTENIAPVGPTSGFVGNGDRITIAELGGHLRGNVCLYPKYKRSGVKFLKDEGNETDRNYTKSRMTSLNNSYKKDYENTHLKLGVVKDPTIKGKNKTDMKLYYQSVFFTSTDLLHTRRGPPVPHKIFNKTISNTFDKAVNMKWLDHPNNSFE
jgi:hypothetical protein